MRDFFTAPAMVDISVTKRCNLRCGYCSASASSDESYIDELSVNEYDELFRQLEEQNILRVSFGGGEPFIRDDFFDILEVSQKYRFAKVINTNGLFINDSTAKKLSSYKFDRICVSLDGSNKEIHEKCRGNDTFDKTVSAIKNLQKYNLPVSTLFTLNTNNVLNLIDCIKFNENLGIEYMTVMVVCPTGRASDGNVLVKNNQWYPIFLKLSEMKANNEINLKFKIVPPNESEIFWLFYFPLEYYNRLDLLKVWNQGQQDYLNKKREISCQAGIKACSIIHNGDVYGCDLMIGIDEFKAGNIRENSFSEIWNNSKVFNSLRNLSFEDVDGKCNKCDKIWCGGGCRSSAYNLTKNILGSDETCFYECINK